MSGRAPRVRRRTAVLGGIAAAGALVLVSRATWFTATFPGGATGLGAGSAPVPVRGSEAAPAVLALGLVALAASLATTISSRVIRFVTGPVLVLAGLGAGLAALSALHDPAGHAAGAVSRATGVLGGQAHITAAPWAMIALLPAAAIIATGVIVLLAGGAWPHRSRYDRTTTADAARSAQPEGSDPAEDPAAAWDALSRGEDPTSP